MKALIFHKMDTEEISDRYVAPCFVNGLEAYNEDDVEPGVVLGRSFMRLTKGIADFGNKTIIIYPELDPLLDSSGEEEKIGDDWDLLLDDLNYGDILDIEGVEILPFEEAEREALAINICRRYSLLEEERPLIETMAYNDKYKKILNRICLDKMKLDGEIKKEDEEAITKVKGEALTEKEDPGAFVILIRLEGNINLNALAATSSDINVMPYRVYKELGREELKNVGVTTIIAKFLILDMPIERDTPIIVGRGFLHTCGSILNIIERIISTLDGLCHQTFREAKTSLDIAESDSDDEEEYAIQRKKFGASTYGPKPAQYLNCNDPMDQSLALQATIGAHDDEAGSSRSKRSRQYETVEEAMLPHWNVLNQMGCGKAIDEMLTIKLCVAGTNEEIFTPEAWTGAFNIDERIYSELCHEFYSTFEFDEVCVAV
ncbi:hypothetical protein Tco_0938774 [Tanacetum coccineum]|uniref:Uncharacterized protein n=1 Tax=Tanacetum coccineum TaxID=301880 RepID=A0ABQ5DPD0_9ASTR